MKSKYMNNGGYNSLGQLGNQKQHRYDPPPQEYMSQSPMRQMAYKRPKAYESKKESPIQLGNLHKEARRQEWLRKKSEKRRGLRQLNQGGQTWN